MKKISGLIISLMLIISLTMPVSYAQYKEKGVAEIYSKNSILVDQLTGRVITEKDADESVPLASISKVMTFYVAQDALAAGEVKENDLVTITKDMLKVSGSTMHLKEGEKVKFIELLKGLMLVSANDGAIAIASHVCDGDVDAFVDRMNEKAKKIGMKNTYFINPNGLPIYDWSKPEGTPPKQNHSSARDISKMAIALLDDYEEETIEITSKRMDKDSSRDFNYYNTNPLIVYPNVDGLKTGYTDLAGYCLVFTNKMSSKGEDVPENRMIGVVMGNWCKEDRVKSATALYKLGENYHTEKICKKGDNVASGCIEDIDELQNINLQAKDDCCAVIKDNEEYTEKVKYKKIDGSINENTVVAELEYIDEYGDVISSVDLVSSDLGSISILSRLNLFAKKVMRAVNMDKTDEKKELPYSVVVF